MPYFSPSKAENRAAASLSVMDMITLSPISFPFLVATSIAVDITLENISCPALLFSYPSIPNIASFRPIRLTTKVTDPFCMYCVLFARIGFNPRLVRSEISFFLSDIAASAGFIKSARRALKYVSSLFDSNASLGMLIESD